MQITRRGWLASGLAAQVPSMPVLPQRKIEELDKAVDGLMRRQILEKGHKYRGSYTSEDGLNYGSTPSQILSVFSTAYVIPGSRHFKSARLAERTEMAAEAFARVQTKDGNFNLPITNFNSPPDTAFIMQSMSITLMNARQYGFPELEKWVLAAVERAGDGLVRGGMHTPNHRWVACSALAGLYKLYGEPKYLRRAEQWLAEGIDQDADGQYTERSTIGYNGICNKALVLVADWLGREEYYAPVRRNLDASLYLLHADGEVVTEISRRQDLNQRGTLANHWPALAHMAWKDRNGQYANLARQYEAAYGSVSLLLRWPQYATGLPESKPLPEDYEKLYPAVGLARIRRGAKSLSILRDCDRLLTYRHGGVVVNAVRFSSAFFGKAQFYGKKLEKTAGGYVMTQELDAGYYQPFRPTRKVTTESYDNTREERERTEICTMRYRVTVQEIAGGVRVRIEANGTEEVPLTVEINLREGVTITGAEKVGKFKDSWLLRSGYAELTSGKDHVRIGPGLGQHTYLEVRGALEKMTGPSLYLTGFTPFDHSFEIKGNS